MKKLIVLILISTRLFSQTDSVYRVSAKDFYDYRKKTNERLDHIEVNLEKHGKLYFTGLTINLVGTALAVASIPVAQEDRSGYVLTGMGGLLALVGTITMWVSHKHIKVAGKGRPPQMTD